ncbi:MAG: hypothetical protein IJM23_04115 [Lachnospiraceae bacterium]|nr:hypothetical protein [Lachnospiraceae bacterium]
MRKSVKRFISGLVSAAMLVSSMPVQQVFASEEDRLMTSENDAPGAQLHAIDSTIPEGVVILPAQTDLELPEEYRDDSLSGNGISYYVMGTGQVDVEEKGIYAITVCRLGDTDSEGSVLVKSIDYSALYGKDYEIKDERFSTERLESEKTLLEKSAEKENIEETRDAIDALLNGTDNVIESAEPEAYGESPEKEEAYIEGMEADDEAFVESIGADDEFVEDTSGDDELVEDSLGENDVYDEKTQRPESSLSLSQLKNRETGHPTRETVEDEEAGEGGDLLGSIQNMLIPDESVNTGDNLVGSSVTEVVFAPGEKEKQLIFEVLEDEESEGDEIIQFSLVTPENEDVVLEPNMSTIMIKDDEPKERSQIAFLQDTYETDSDSIKVTLVRQGAKYNLMTASLSVKNRNDAKDAMVKEISFQPYLMEKDIELNFNLGDEAMDYDLELCDIKGGDPGDIIKASIHVESAVKRSSSDVISREEDADGAAPESVEHQAAEDGSQIKINDHLYTLEAYTDGSKPESVYKIMSLPNDTILDRKNPVQVGDYYAAKSDYFRTKNMWYWGDSPHKDYSGWNSSGQYMTLDWYSNWPHEEGGASMSFEIPMRPYAGALLDYTALSDWSSVETCFSAKFTEKKQVEAPSGFGFLPGIRPKYAYVMGSTLIDKNLRVTRRQNGTEDNDDKSIENREFMGPIRMLNGKYVGQGGKNSQMKTYSEEGKIPYMGIQNTEFVTYTGKTSFGAINPTEHVYGVACMYKVIKFNVEEPSKLQYKKADGSTSADFPARVFAPDDHPRFYGETLTVDIEQNDTDIRVPKGRIKGWVIKPKDGKEFTVNVADAVAGKVSYLSRDGLTFTINDDFIDTLSKQEIGVKKGDMTDTGYLMNVSIKPVFEYIPVHVRVLPSDGEGSFSSSLIKEPKEYTFNVGDTINLSGTPGDGWYYSGYSLTTYKNYDDTQAKTDAPVVLTPLDVKLSNDELYVIRPVFIQEDNRIEIEMTEDAKKYFEIQGLCSQDELPDYLKGKNILRIENRLSDSDPVTRPVPGDAYEIRLLNTSNNDGSYRPVFTIVNTGQTVNGHVMDFIAEPGADGKRNRIKVDAKKVDPGKYKYFEITGKAVYSSAKLRNADGTKTTEAATGVEIKTAGRSVSGYKDGKKTQVLFRSTSVSDTDGNFILKGIEAVPGDTISVRLDNGDRQQVKYVDLPGTDDGEIRGLSSSECTLEVFVPNDSTKTMETRSQKTQVYAVHTEPMGMPIISPRAPEVKKLTYTYDEHEMRDTTKNMVELRPDEEIWVSVEVLEKKDNQIKGVDFILYDKNGKEKELDEKGGGTQHGTSNGDGTEYKVKLKSDVGLKAGDTLYVQIQGSEYTTVTYSNGDTDKVYKKYPKLNSGLTFGDVIERPDPQTFTIRPDTGDAMQKFPFIGDTGSDMMSNTGSLNLKKTYIDPEHPDTSPYYMTVGLSLSVGDMKKQYRQLDRFRNGKHEDEQKDFNEKLEEEKREGNPYNYADAVEKQALRNAWEMSEDGDDFEDRAKEWEDSTLRAHEDDIKKAVRKQQIADSITKLNDNNGSIKEEQPKWDFKVCVAFILEYVLDTETNDYVFAGGQYMVGLAGSYSRTWHWFAIVVPVYFSMKFEISMVFDGSWVSDAGKKNFAEFKQTKNLEEYLVPKWPWCTIGFKGKFMPGVGIYGVIGARGQIDFAINGRFTNAKLDEGKSRAGLLVSLGGGIGIDLLALKFNKSFPVATYRTGCFKEGNYVKNVGAMQKDTGKLEAFDLSGKEISHFGKRSSQGDLESAGLGIKAPANIEAQNVLVDNAAEYIRPHIVYGQGNKRFITYLKKDGKGNSRIAYAVDDGHGFSQERFVDPDVTNGTDTTSDLLYADGKVYLAWTHADEAAKANVGDQDVVSVVDAKDALQSMNLQFAVYDFASGKMSSPVAVTDDRFLNGNVRLFAEDDKVDMYFYKKDIDAVETMQQLISEKSNYTTWAMAEYDTVSEDFVKYKEGDDWKNWKFVEIKKPMNDPLVLDYASAVFDPDKDNISVSSNSWRMSLYTVDRGLNSDDEDKRSEGMSFADSEIWLCASKTGEEGQEFYAKLAEGDVTNARLNIMSDDVLITWLGESKTLYTLSAQSLFKTDDEGITVFEHYCNNDTYEAETGEDGGHETRKYEIAPSQKQFAENDDELVSLFQYQVVSGADGNDYLFTLAPGDEDPEENGQELWGATYYRGDPATGERSGWGELTQITHYKKIIDEMSLAVNENHQASILANIYDNEVDETGLSSGNYKLVELDCEPETSLVFNYEPYFDGWNRYPMPGEEAWISFSLENEGLLPAKNYRIDVTQIQNGQEKQACEPIIYNADPDEYDNTIYTGQEKMFSVSVNMPASVDGLSYEVAVTETEAGDGSKTYGTNKATVEVEKGDYLIESSEPYIFDGQSIIDTFDHAMLRYQAKGGRELTEAEMNEIEDALDDQELLDLYDLYLITGTKNLNELSKIDPVEKGLGLDKWYAIAYFANLGNQDAKNVKASATHVLDGSVRGEILGESRTIESFAKRDVQGLAIPIDTKKGTLFNDIGVLNLSFDVTVDGEEIGDEISLMAYTSENVGICRDDGLESFELAEGESVNLDMVSHPFSDRADLNYVSDNMDVAVVSEDGVVTAIGDGECSIYVYDYSAADGLPYTKVKISVDGAGKKEDVRVPVVQTLSENRLTFDSVEDGDTLYLLKGGKYTYEEGLIITPAVKKAVKQKPRKLKLIVRKDSVLTLQKGDKTKTVTMRAMKVKKKKVTLNAQKKSFTLSELFTGLEALMPDVQGGQYAVTVKKDIKGVLKWEGMPQADGKYITLDSVSVNAAGNRGSAKITAVFGGKKYNATVKYK